MRQRLLIAFLALAVALPQLALAQAPPTYTLTSEQGTLDIAYPPDWVVSRGQSSIPYIVISNQPTVTSTSPSAMVEIAIVPAENLQLDLDHQADNPASAYFQAFREARISAGYGVFSNVYELEFGSAGTHFDGAMMTFLEEDEATPLSSSRKINIGLAVVIDPATLLIVDMQSIDSQAEQMIPIWDMMIDSMTWNNRPLINNAVRGVYEDLESPTQLRQHYLALYEDQPDFPSADMTTRYEIDADTVVISFYRPRGWLAEENDYEIVLQNATMAEAVITVRWFPNSTTIPSDEKIDIIATETFTWGGFDANGFTYRAEETIGAGFGIVLPDEAGILVIGLECLPADWQLVQMNLLVVAGGLAFDEEWLPLNDLVQVFNSLETPIS